MGSLSKYSRCDAFIKEFGEEIIKRQDIQGSFIIGQRLDTNESDECVYHYLTIRDAKRDEWDLMVPGVLYDPEPALEDSNLDRLCDVLLDRDESFEVKEKELAERMRKAGLLEDDEEGDNEC